MITNHYVSYTDIALSYNSEMRPYQSMITWFTLAHSGIAILFLGV